MRPVFILGLFLVLFPIAVYANGATVSNVVYASNPTSSQIATIQFDITWSNSWRDTTNHDAVWIFMKYSTDSGNTWNHAKMQTAGTNPSGTSVGSGTALEIVIPNDLTGAFLRRASEGSGTTYTTSVQLVWNYGVDSLSYVTVDTLSWIKVYAIEMVYVPEDDFYIGDGNTSSESARAFHVTDNTAVRVTTDAVSSLSVDNNSDDDIDTASISVDGNNGISNNANFPTGWRAFYIMKYELTQKMYRDFLNSLSRAQQTTRVASVAANQYTMSNTTSEGERNFIRNPSTIAASGPYTFGIDYATDGSSGDGVLDDSFSDAQGTAMNHMHWMDLAAFCDWAGLRPMTELEFEKAARGPSNAVTGEYAWGTTTITSFSLVNSAGQAAETANASGHGLANYGSNFSGGVVRAGFAATSSTSTRTAAGAAYYGISDMTGNAAEMAVTVGNATGRAYQGTHGDGVLTTTASFEGNATNLDWPGIDATTSKGVTTGTGSGSRGGHWSVTAVSAAVSDRTYASLGGTTRLNYLGGRAVRSSPEYE